jgi:hypothetical protein
VLIAEVAELRGVKVGVEASSEAHQEIQRLMKEAKVFKEKYDKLEQRSRELEVLTRLY